MVLYGAHGGQDWSWCFTVLKMATIGNVILGNPQWPRLVMVLYGAQSGHDWSWCFMVHTVATIGHVILRSPQWPRLVMVLYGAQSGHDCDHDWSCYFTEPTVATIGDGALRCLKWPRLVMVFYGVHSGHDWGWCFMVSTVAPIGHGVLWCPQWPRLMWRSFLELCCQRNGVAIAAASYPSFLGCRGPTCDDVQRILQAGLDRRAGEQTGRQADPVSASTTRINCLDVSATGLFRCCFMQRSQDNALNTVSQTIKYKYHIALLKEFLFKFQTDKTFHE
ncbi:hypothetical protein RRG08_057022 [Elysia crispata]|uniref:Uncharacterized protein n=1 Tax=Elysia crispata TaxID=231223 RepID=A0AAE0Z6A2_9GAST|nr:hypothetical protein RRG08_057022 [Elysia crispata]